MENELESSVTITQIQKRANYITRVSPANKNQHHIIASNIDQSLLFATLKDPKTSQGFIDRFLISSESFFKLSKINLTVLADISAVINNF